MKIFCSLGCPSKWRAGERLLVGEGVVNGSDFEWIGIGDGSCGGNVGLRDAILPGEMVFVPERPEIAEHQRCA